jgi:surface polysaccharide O-acyltransferase-like enzyme
MTSSRDERCGAIDWLRFIALIEIAGYHSRMGRIPLLDGLGLPLLLVITNLYNCKLTEYRGLLTFLRDKARRLLVPWLFWCAVYGVVLAVKAFRDEIPLTTMFPLRTLVAGTYPHLWFVPFALFAAIVVAALQRAARRWRPVPVIAGAMLVGAALAFADARFDYLRAWGEPWPQWSFSLPSIFFGYAIGRSLLLDAAERRVLLPVLIACGGLVWVLSASLDGPRQYERYGGAILLSASALLLSARPDRVIAFLAPLTLGIYLAHALVMRLLIAAGISWKSSLAWALVDIAVTILLVWTLRRTPLRRIV